jgi:hypothetical protein
LPSCKSISKKYSPLFHGIQEVITFKYQSYLFWGSFLKWTSLLQNSWKSMVFFIIWVFWKSLLNQVEHTWLKIHPYICEYEWARICFLDKGLASKPQHHRIWIFFEKIKDFTFKLKWSHWRWSHAEPWAKKKEVENPRFYGHNKPLIWHPTLRPFGNFSLVAAYRSSLKSMRKMNLQLIFHHRLIRSWNLTCLRLLKGLWNLQFTCPKNKSFLIDSLFTTCPNSKWSILDLKEF